MRHARSLMAGAVVLLSSFLVWGCGSELKTCKSEGNCEAIAGSYGVDTSQVQGKCDFTPYTLPSTLVVEQSTDLSQVTVGVLDQVTQQSLALTGDLYAPDAKDSKSKGSISLTRQTVRLATPTSSDTMTFQIIFSASVTQDASGKPYVLGGSLATTSLPSGGGTSCTLTVTFSASRSG